LDHVLQKESSLFLIITMYLSTCNSIFYFIRVMKSVNWFFFSSCTALMSRKYFSIMIKWFRVKMTMCVYILKNNDNFVLYQSNVSSTCSIVLLVNLFQKNLAVGHSTKQWTGSDQCHGNKDNQVASFFHFAILWTVLYWNTDNFTLLVTRKESE